MSRHPSRRSLLVATGAVLAGAGCLDGGGDPDGVIIEELGLSNTTEERRTFHLVVHFDGEVIHWEEYEVEGRDGHVVHGVTLEDDELPSEPGDYEVLARTGDHVARSDASYWGDGVCLRLRCDFDGDHLAFWGNSQECPDRFEE